MHRTFKFYDSSSLPQTSLYISLGLILVLGIISTPLLAAADTSEEINWWQMGMELFGGLALFLYGMEQMADALKTVAGERMKIILAKLTNNRLMGMLTGAFVTAVIQSSSVTTVMLVGFVSAGMMSLTQAVGVILGADIGTTITAQIVAFKVTKFALIMVAVGFSMLFFSQQEKIKGYGSMIMGLGLIFFGMGIMSDGMKPLRDYQPFIDLMRNVSNPLVGIMVATFFTALVQSSSATMGVVIALALQGLVSLEGGIALALGANIGTCVTAGLASIGRPREAVRVAVAHVTFKVVGVLLIVAFIPQFADFVRYVSPSETGLTGFEKLAAETPRQIANAHTMFNVGIAFCFLPLAGYFARFCEWVVPDKPIEEQVITAPKYLDDVLLETPTLALDRVRMEIGHMGSRVQEMMVRSMPAFLSGDQEELEEVIAIDDEVDLLYGHIVSYLGKIAHQPLTEAQSEMHSVLMAAANEVEAMGDLIETDAAALFETCMEKGIKISEPTQEILSNLHKRISLAVDQSLEAVSKNDERLARKVIGAKMEINKMVDDADAHLARRLSEEDPDKPERLAHYSVEIEIIEKLKRIYYFAKRISRGVIPKEIQAKAVSV